LFVFIAERYHAGMAEAPSLPDPARIRAIERPHPRLLTLYIVMSLAAFIFAPIVLIPLFFKYHTLRYRIDDEGIGASWGILFRREIHLTYKRIQDIHVKRNIVERWLGIATVEIQTASGSSSAELSLEGMDDYEAVRDFLYAHMRGHVGATKEHGEVPAEASNEAEVVALLNGIRDELVAAREALEGRG
jgi:putative membrane protein